MTGYHLHPEAVTDIDEIAAYIGQDSPQDAHDFVDEIFDAIRAVAAFPHLGHVRPDLTSRPVRFIRVRDYLIAYVPEQKPFWVIAVVHGHRSPSAMAAILSGREL